MTGSVRSRLAAGATDAGFAAGWHAVRMLPEPAARGLFDRAGRWAAGRDGKGTRQLRANLGHGPRTTVPGGLAVYGRQRRPCLACGTPIAMRRHGRQARSTYWCPRCQVAPVVNAR